MSDQSVRAYRLVIRERYCKGCGICVAFCPRQVLSLKSGKAFAGRPERCIGCRMCELRCPDFAVEVHPAGDEPDKPEGGEIDFTLPPEALHG